MNHDALTTTASSLKQAASTKSPPKIFAGVDGFTDEIIRVVDKRHSVESFHPIATITEYAKRIAGAAGKSTNIEFVVTQIKAGGNGPLMSEAFGRLGGQVRYVGAVGWPDVHELFQGMEKYGPITPVAPPAITLATEFDDGKIMHGKHEALRQLTWENIVERSGGIDAIDGFLKEADLVAIVNWTMVPFLNDVLAGILDRVNGLGNKAPSWYFFDLCDPEKRTHEDLVQALEIMAKFEGSGRRVVLGLNEKESTEVCSALKLEPGEANEDGLLERAERIARHLSMGEVMIHPTRMAVAWSLGDDESTVSTGKHEGPFCPSPKLTTGAGDHFNGGYMFARLLGLTPQEAIITGKSVSGFYVREGRGPSVEEVLVFIDRWKSGVLDPWKPVT
ncbi:MAG: carbohydrate kinase family protein [Candidatus Sumerlaeia bacterium]|nr:carbohydrate kinase family protein [Candidatus Sumerlaeia bacterium]